jgi:hypothetical protein
MRIYRNYSESRFRLFKKIFVCSNRILFKNYGDYMQTQNFIDLSNLPIEYHKLAFDYIDYLRFISHNNTQTKTNYDKVQLLAAFELVQKKDIFSEIPDSIEWQKEIRDDR